MDQFLTENYIGGKKKFYRTIYKNLNYPVEARASCITGRVAVVLEIDSLGEVASLKFKNKIDYKIEEAMEAALNFTKVNWKKTNLNRELEISFGFKHENLRNDFSADFEAFGLNGSHQPDKDCFSEEQMRIQMHYYIKHAGREKGRLKCEKLLKRHPWSTYLDSLYTELSIDMKKE